MGLLFWVLIFVLSSRVLRYFQSVEVIGDLLAHHLLAMILLTFFSLLIFSNIIAALSNLYLSSDLELCHASPAPMDAVFLSRSFHTMVDSSWMVLVFGLPIMMAYAYVYRPDIGFYMGLAYMGPALAVIAAGIGILFTMIMVSIFPAQRTRDIIMLLMIVGIVALYLLFRLLRPERLVDPDAFFSMMQYVTALKSPDSPYLPTHWMTQVLWEDLSDTQVKGRFFENILLCSTAGAITFINIWVARGIYFIGFSKSQEAKRRRKGKGLLDLLSRTIQRPLGPDLAAISDKDIRTFFRDNTQWSQLLLLGALAVVYLYNFSVLPLERSPIRLEFLQNQIAFMNMALAAFVLSAVSVRFIFPAVSSEGGAFWIIRSSPITIKRFLWGKFIIYIFPMLFLAEMLIIITNVLLKVTPLMMILSSLTIFLAVFGIVALAMGFGAIYPKFKYENISQVSTGYGGLMYMIFCALFMAVIIILEAGPVYILFMADLKGKSVTALQWLFIIPSFAAVLIIQWLAIFKPMKMGVKALERYE
jgi:ABC-2 type transport system permease protein